MRLRTLGGVRFEGSDFTRPKPLLLATYLAMEGPRPRRHLAQLFWPDARDPMRSLSVALTRLRKGAPGAVAADRRRAEIRASCDAAEFLGHLDRGERQQALELYEGPFLDGLDLPAHGAELEEWLNVQREHLAGRALRALLEEAEARAAEGRIAAAADLAESAARLRWTDPDPDELERMHALLAAAGRAFADHVRRQAEELGLTLPDDPERAQARLFTTSMAQEPARGGLPRRDTAFVGRDGERIEVASLLARPGPALTTLLGPPGVGKTRLAIEIAREQRAIGAFPGGATPIDLERIDEPEALPTLVAEALGLGEAPTHDAALERVAARLDGPRTLLVLDNAEHLAGGATAFLRLADACPSAALLATSRERLRLERERVVPIAGLPYPGDEGVPLEEALAYEAVELFVRRARRAAPSFAPTPEMVPAILRICRRVEGLPLALELAAAWVRVLTTEEIADEIDERLELLANDAHDAPRRHRSMRSVFEHVWALLASRDHELLRRLSACQSGFDREAATGIAGAGLVDLATLIDRSLLRTDGHGRYGAHPLLLEFAREKAAELPDEAADARRSHQRVYLGLLRRHEEDLAGGDQETAMAAVSRELENVLAAWRHAAERGDARALWEACRPLQLYFIQRGGRWDDAAQAFADARMALERADPSSVAPRGRLGAAEAWFRFRRGELDASERLAREALEALEPLSDAETPDPTADRALASILNTLGNVAKKRGDKAEAARRFEQVLELARRRDQERQVAIASHNLASVRSDLGDYATAEALYRDALEINLRRSNRRSIVRNLVNMGNLALHAGDPERAEATLHEGLELARSIGFDALVPILKAHLGEAARARGNDARARTLLEEALGGLGDGSHPSFEAEVRAGLADTAADAGRTREAREGYVRALRLAWPCGERDTVASCLTGLARLSAQEDDVARAALLLDAARAQDGLTHHVRDRALLAERELGLAPPDRTPGPADARAVIEGLLGPSLDHGVDDTV